jgi:hypothetical protein
MFGSSFIQQLLMSSEGMRLRNEVEENGRLLEGNTPAIVWGVRKTMKHTRQPEIRTRYRRYTSLLHTSFQQPALISTGKQLLKYSN